MALGFRDFQGLGSKALENAWCKPYCKSIDVSATYFLYVYIYIYTHIHTDVHTYLRTYIHTYTDRDGLGLWSQARPLVERVYC